MDAHLKRPGVAVVAAALVFAAAPGTGHAAVCGRAGHNGAKPAVATLKLDASSRTTISFERSTAAQHLSLIFNTSGCDLEATTDPRVVALPIKDLDELPDDALTVTSALTNGAKLIVELKVDPKKFDAGTRGAALVLKAPYLAGNQTPVTISRSESNKLEVFGLSLLAAAAGVLWLLLTKLDALPSIKTRALAALSAVALLSGLWAALTSYFSQSVWSFHANWLSLVGAAFAAATGSALAGILGAGGKQGS